MLRRDKPRGRYLAREVAHVASRPLGDMPGKLQSVSAPGASGTKSLKHGTSDPMEFLMNDLVLPAFEMDCRDWMVVSPRDAGLPDEIVDVPLLAVLTTVVIDDDVHEATGALTVGILDQDDDLPVRPVDPESPAQELVDADELPGTRRFVMPAPNQQLALLAEFVVQDDAGPSDDELDQRVEKLMASFRWQLEPV